MGDFRVVIEGLTEGDIWQNVFHVSADDDAAGVAATVDANVTDWWDISFHHSGTSYERVVVRDYNVATGALGSDMGALSRHLAGGAATSMPTECSLCVTLRTNDFKIHGRYYMPPMATAVLAGSGRVDTSILGVIADLQQAFWEALGSADSPVRLNVYSRTLRSIHGVLTLELGNVVDAQRRRRNQLTEARVSRDIT